MPLAKEIMERAAEQGVTLLLPKDIVVGDTLDNGATTKARARLQSQCISAACGACIRKARAAPRTLLSHPASCCCCAPTPYLLRDL